VAHFGGSYERADVGELWFLLGKRDRKCEDKYCREELFHGVGVETESYDFVVKAQA
jgi:hypothetical protein